MKMAPKIIETQPEMTNSPPSLQYNQTSSKIGRKSTKNNPPIQPENETNWQFVTKSKKTHQKLAKMGLDRPN